MGFAEPVLGLAKGKTRGLDPSYGLPPYRFCKPVFRMP
jgi:hypothetical protein